MCIDETANQVQNTFIDIGTVCFFTGLAALLLFAISWGGSLTLACCLLGSFGTFSLGWGLGCGRSWGLSSSRRGLNNSQKTPYA